MGGQVIIRLVFNLLVDLIIKAWSHNGVSYRGFGEMASLLSSSIRI